MVKKPHPDDRKPLLHDPEGHGVIGRQGSEPIDDKDGRAQVSFSTVLRFQCNTCITFVNVYTGDLCARGF